MVEEYMLSVVIPAYNMRTYIHDAVNSVLRQPMADRTEIICVDDGSEDGTAEYCIQAFDSLDRVRVLALDHHGVSHARNEGMAAAAGRYLAFLDADDIWTEGVFDPEVLALLDDSPDLLGLGWTTLSAEAARSEIHPSKAQTLHGGYQAVLEGERSFACYFYRSAFLRTRGLRFPTGVQVNEDEVFRTLCLYFAETVRFSDRILFHNRLRANSLRSIRYSDAVRTQLIRVWTDLLRTFKETAPGDLRIRDYCRDRLQALLDKFHRERRLDNQVLDLCSPMVDVSQFCRILRAPKVLWLESMHRKEIGLLILCAGGLRPELRNRFSKAFSLVPCEEMQQGGDAPDCAAAIWFTSLPQDLEEGLQLLRLHAGKKLFVVHLEQPLTVVAPCKLPSGWREMVTAAHQSGVLTGFVWQEPDEGKYRIWADSETELDLVWDIYSASFPGRIRSEECWFGGYDD